jgi:hypothetical protein
MRQSPADLGRMLAIDRAAGLGRVEIIAAAVGVEAERQAMLAEHLQQGLERRGGLPLQHHPGKGRRGRLRRCAPRRLARSSRPFDCRKTLVHV